VPLASVTALDGLRELDLQSTRQVEPMLGIHEVGDATLARLAIHPDDRLVGAAGVHGVDGQVGNLPLAVLLADGRHPLLDGVLVRAENAV